MKVVHMAWRNVWRSRRRSLVTISAMTFGLWAMIVYSALMEGYIAGLEHNVLDVELGDVQIHAPHYRSDPSLYATIADPEAIIERLDAAGFRASARLLGAGMAAAGDASGGVSLRGIDPARNAEVSSIGEHVARGRWLDSDDPHGVVIGRRLAKILDVDVGSEILILSQGTDGSVANDVYTVLGVLASVSDSVDRSGVYMTAPAFRELMVLPTGAHEIVVRRPADLSLDEATAKIAELAPGLDVASWRQLVPTLASMLDATRAAMTAMLVIVYIAIGMVILNATLMAVFERVREFGVLEAIGMSPGAIMRIVFEETGVQTVVAVLTAVVLAVPSLLWLRDHGIDLSSLAAGSLAGIAWDPIWRAEINEHVFLDPIVTMVVIVQIAVFYPALKAALIQPVEAMHRR